MYGSDGWCALVRSEERGQDRRLLNMIGGDDRAAATARATAWAATWAAAVAAVLRGGDGA